MIPTYYYTFAELKEAVATSFSVAETLRKLDLVPKGGNYATVKRRIKREGLDTSHFTCSRWNKGLKTGVSTVTILEEGLNISTNALKKRLINENYLLNQCDQCKLVEWNNKPLTLELHHIDGNNKNNTLLNLILLCPNCHSQTDNYRGLNINKTRKKEKVPITLCADCGLKCSRNALRCVSCNRVKHPPPTQKIEFNYPDLEMESILEKLSYMSRRSLAKELGMHYSTLGYRVKAYKKLIPGNVCCCGKSIDKRSKRCVGCTPKNTKIEWPSTEYLLERLKNTPYITLAKELGVSDNAIRKRIKNYPI